MRKSFKKLLFMATVCMSLLGYNLFSSDLMFGGSEIDLTKYMKDSYEQPNKIEKVFTQSDLSNAVLFCGFFFGHVSVEFSTEEAIRSHFIYYITQIRRQMKFDDEEVNEVFRRVTEKDKIPTDIVALLNHPATSNDEYEKQLRDMPLDKLINRFCWHVAFYIKTQDGDELSKIVVWKINHDLVSVRGAIASYDNAKLQRETKKRETINRREKKIGEKIRNETSTKVILPKESAVEVVVAKPTLPEKKLSTCQLLMQVTKSKALKVEISSTGPGHQLTYFGYLRIKNPATGKFIVGRAQANRERLARTLTIENAWENYQAKIEEDPIEKPSRSARGDKFAKACRSVVEKKTDESYHHECEDKLDEKCDDDLSEKVSNSFDADASERFINDNIPDNDLNYVDDSDTVLNDVIVPDVEETLRTSTGLPSVKIICGPLMTYDCYTFTPLEVLALQNLYKRIPPKDLRQTFEDINLKPETK